MFDIEWNGVDVLIVDWGNLAALSIFLIAYWLFAFMIGAIGCGYDSKWEYIIFCVISTIIIVIGWVWFGGSPILL